MPGLWLGKTTDFSTTCKVCFAVAGVAIPGVHQHRGNAQGKDFCLHRVKYILVLIPSFLQKLKWF